MRGVAAKNEWPTPEYTGAVGEEEEEPSQCPQRDRSTVALGQDLGKAASQLARPHFKVTVFCAC